MKNRYLYMHARQQSELFTACCCSLVLHIFAASCLMSLARFPTVTC